MRWLPQEWNRKLVELLQLSAPLASSAVCWLAAVRCDMRHTRCKGAWPQEWNRKCVAVEVAPSSSLVGA